MILSVWSRISSRHRCRSFSLLLTSNSISSIVAEEIGAEANAEARSPSRYSEYKLTHLRFCTVVALETYTNDGGSIDGSVS
jgi:hypothetical protein